jgi:hypothetical protein
MLFIRLEERSVSSLYSTIPDRRRNPVYIFSYAGDGMMEGVVV